MNKTTTFTPFEYLGNLVEDEKTAKQVYGLDLQTTCSASLLPFEKFADPSKIDSAE